jgi:TatD DNase family protein
MVDSHCHIDLCANPMAVAREAERLKIATVAVTYLPSHFELAEQRLQPFKYVRPALGLHPMAAREHRRELPKFLALVGRVQLIGEIGLDLSVAGRSMQTAQEESFSAVLDAIKGTRKFVTLHSRGAEDAVFAYLKTAGLSSVVFHWFTGNERQLIRVLDAGYSVSINPAMIRTKKWLELIKRVPKSAVLTESDGPFAKRGKIPALPIHVHEVLLWLSERWKCPPETVGEIVDANFGRLATFS